MTRPVHPLTAQFVELVRERAPWAAHQEVIAVLLGTHKMVARRAIYDALGRGFISVRKDTRPHTYSIKQETNKCR